MDSFISMKTKLDATGLYNIEQGSNIYAELKAYAAGMDMLFEQLSTMLRELFIETATDYGLDNRELLLGRQKDEYSIESRREMLTIYEQMMGGKCTPQAFELILRGYGLEDFTITEEPQLYRVTIDIRDILTDVQQNYVNERVQADFPSHLDIVLNYI